MYLTTEARQAVLDLSKIVDDRDTMTITSAGQQRCPTSQIPYYLVSIELADTTPEDVRTIVELLDVENIGERHIGGRLRGVDPVEVFMVASDDTSAAAIDRAKPVRQTTVGF